MTWQSARLEAEGLATAATPSSQGEVIQVPLYETPQSFRDAGGFRDWSWEFHRDVMAALARIYSKRGFKVMREKA